MNLTKKIILSLFLIFITLFKAQADSPKFESLSQAEANSIAEEFSANFVHTSVAPASTLGSIFGFEVGILGGMASTPEIEKVAKRADSSTDISMVPHAGVLGRVSVPFGITVELSYLPEITASGISVENTSFALQYTPDFLAFLPVAIAAKIHGSSSKLSFNQTIGADADGKVAVDSTTYGIQFLVSANLLVFEPYAGVGFVKSDTDIKTTAQGNGTIFDFSNTDNFNSKNDGFHLAVGSEINLAFFNIGVEYGNIMGVSRYTGKFSFSF